MFTYSLTQGAQMGASYFGGNLYIVRDQRNVSYVHRCPRDLLPYSDDHPDVHQAFLGCEDDTPRVWKGADVSFSTREVWNEVWYEPLGVLCTDPARGAPVVTLHHIFSDDDYDPRAINIRFWSAEQPKPSEADASHLSPAHSFNLGGSVRRSTLGSNLYAYSGSQLLLVVELNGILALRLVRYHPITSSSSVHLFELPRDIDLEEIQDISLDDHRGIIFLINTSGLVTILPYA
jgi:hypothetical protein